MLFESMLQKGGGPYIGPRGGKWADPKHTIAWREKKGHATKEIQPVQMKAVKTTLDKIDLASLKGLRLSNRPPKSIDPKTVTVDTMGDVHSKAVLKWRDSKGRAQAAYTEVFQKRTAAIKWDRVRALERRVPSAVTTLQKQLNDPKASQRERDSAAALLIIINTGLRPGGVRHLKATGSKGITTLGPGNVQVAGDSVKLAYKGKAGKHNTGEVVHVDLAKYVQERLKARGGQAALWEATDADLPKAMKRAGLEGFKPKDFRTRHAGRTAAQALAGAPKPPPPMPKDPAKAASMIRKHVMAASKIVAKILNNTPAVARASYISPAIIQAWVASVGGVAKAGMGDVAEKLWRASLRYALPEHGKRAVPIPEHEDDPPEELEAYPLPEAALAKAALFEALLTKGGPYIGSKGGKAALFTSLLAKAVRPCA